MRIFDNEQSGLDDVLLTALRATQRMDICVGYMTFSGYHRLIAGIDGYSGTEESCCRLLIGMYADARHRNAQDAVTSLIAAMGKQLEDEDGTQTVTKLIEHLRTRKTRVSLFRRDKLHAKIYLFHRSDPLNPIAAYLGSSNLSFNGLDGQGELNLELTDRGTTAQLSTWFDSKWADDWTDDITEIFLQQLQTKNIPTASKEDGIYQTVNVSDLLRLYPNREHDALLGTKRFITRGGSCLIAAPTGVGKSTLAMQALCCWAVGRDFFGIPPIKVLKSALIQTENDEGDLSEMIHGICTVLNFSEAERTLLDQNVAIVHDFGGSERDRIQIIEKVLANHKPDLLWLDPLFDFIDGDVNSQTVVSRFLRRDLKPLLVRYRCALMLIHHTGKKNGTGSYAGFGSSDISNYFRAILNIIPTKQSGVFEIEIPKRDQRSGLTHRFISHSSNGLAWVPVQDCFSNRLSGRERGTDHAAFLELFQPDCDYSSREATDLLMKAAKCRQRKAGRLLQELAPFFSRTHSGRTVLYRRKSV